jgi:predicted metalloprotease with PDZ domain
VEWDRLLKDFKLFTDKQLQKFKEFPTKEYHFLCQIVPYKAYHGVEHCKSTVILLGPTYDVFGSLYKELLGVSSHELYHTWNVKAIRPIELFPYNFKQENYSELGYICEGITTYMGDMFLLKSGVFSLESYLMEFKNQLQKHFDNPARFNYSVAESSFDTWLDGYTPGAPGRKVSIYTEGCLLAFVTDVKILKATINRFCLDDVMRVLYFDYAVKGKGVSEADYKAVLEQVSSVNWDEFFNDFIHGTQPFESILADSLDYLGLELTHRPLVSYSAGKLGMKVIPGTLTVATIYTGSPADLGGLMLNDEIIAVNDVLCQGELDKWLAYFDNQPKKVTVNRAGRLHTIHLPEVNRNFYLEYYVQPITTKPTKLQINALDKWMK